MPKGISLHLGLNNVNSAHYMDILPLKGPVQDAKDMAEAAQKLFGYKTSQVLLEAEATAAPALASTSASGSGAVGP